MVEQILTPFNMFLVFFCIFMGIAVIIQKIYYKLTARKVDRKPRKYYMQLTEDMLKDYRRDPYFEFLRKLYKKKD